MGDAMRRRVSEMEQRRQGQASAYVYVCGQSNRWDVGMW
jgi:hypothetical protein